jgi:hypothetical protein
MTLPPLVLTGGPAAGKSTTAHALAARRTRCAVVDVDDVRQLVVSGAAAPWEGLEGREQQRLGVTNACGLARNFLAPDSDHRIAVGALDPRNQTDQVARLWEAPNPSSSHAPILAGRTQTPPCQTRSGASDLS